jgi:hypothetical protein
MREEWGKPNTASAAQILRLDKVAQAVKVLHAAAQRTEEHLAERVRLHTGQQVQYWAAQRGLAAQDIDVTMGYGDHPAPEALERFTKAHAWLSTWNRVQRKLGDDPLAALRGVRAEVGDIIRRGPESLIQYSYGHSAEMASSDALEEFLAATNYVGD